VTVTTKALEEVVGRYSYKAAVNKVEVTGPGRGMAVVWKEELVVDVTVVVEDRVQAVN
jgi:hypothetical protein